jgi:hypothetical protein
VILRKMKRREFAGELVDPPGEVLFNCGRPDVFLSPDGIVPVLNWGCR